VIVIGFGGEPATGKSKLMKAAMTELNEQPMVTDVRMGSHTIKLTIFFKNDVTVIGHYQPGDTFGGTDRLSMSIQPSMEEYIKILLKRDSDTSLWFEGDRLFNVKFIEYLKSFQEITSFFFILDARENIKVARHAERDNQNESWLRGRATKVRNIKEKFDLPVVYNNIESDIAVLVKFILQVNVNLLAKQKKNSKSIKELGY